MTRIPLPDGYELDDDRHRLDLDQVYDLLQREAYWGRWRDREMIRRQFSSAWRVVGVYHIAESGSELVGFGRAVADGESLGYLADVLIAPAHRGRGLGTTLARAIVDHGSAAHWRWMLHTRDAHGLYAKLGFAPPDDTYLERPRAQGV